MTETKLKRSWFRFSIRDLLWLTVVVAVGVGWWIDHRRLVDESTPSYREQQLQAKVDELQDTIKIQRRLMELAYKKAQGL